MTTFDEKIGPNQRFENYLQRWGLKSDPFKLELPSLDAFVPAQQEDIRRLKWILTDGKVGILTGTLGMGKTTICEFLVASLKEESLAVTEPSKQVVPVFIHGATYKSTDELLRAIILGLEMDASKDRTSLFEILHRWPQEHQERLAIIVDDFPEGGADVREVGEFLRALADIQGITILLNGDPKKMQRFIMEMPALRDRIQAHVELRPMKKEQLRELLEFRLKNAGCTNCDGLLAQNGIEELYKLSKGIPRRALKAVSNAFHYAAKKDTLIDASAVNKSNRRPLLRRIFSFRH